MRYLLYIVTLFLFTSAFAQKGNVSIIKDERIDALIRQKSVIIPPATAPQMQGYRIQLIFDSNKKTVDDAKSRFVSNHSKIDTYVTYNAPHFILKVGDFRSRQDAEKVREGLIRDFPTSFVIKETINLPRID
jgi:hypothetical protein